MSDQNPHGTTKTKVFPLPPKDFNPLTAEHGELVHFGYPRRPDPKKEPEAFPHWQRLYARPMRLIDPNFIEHLFPTDLPISRPRSLTYGQNGWAGSVITPANTPYNQAITSASGVWTITPVQLPADEVSWVATWVGIDGSSTTDPVIVQAGTAQGFSVPILKGQTSVVWSEWVPAGAVAVDFPANVGDDFGVSVSLQSSTEALVWLYDFPPGRNADTVSTHFQIQAPNGSPAAGLSAEWIVESPGGEWYALPDFGTIKFPQTGGLTVPYNYLQGFFDGSYGQPVEMTDAQGNVMATANIGPEGEVTITWVAAT